MNSESLKAIELLVSESVADEVKQKGLTEIVLRRVDQKFRSFVKCRIIDNTGKETGEKLLESALNQQAFSMQDVAYLRKALESLDLSTKRLPLMNSKLKELSIKADNLLYMSNAVKSLSFLNAGLTLTNVAVSVTGFYVINESFKRVTRSINSIEKEISVIKDLDFASDISQPAEELQIRYGFIYDKLKTGKPVLLSDLEEYMAKINPYLSKIIKLLYNPSIDAESLLNIIFVLIPVYSSVLSLYLKTFYFENHQTPTNYDRFLEIYQKLNSEEFSKKVLDSYFLSGKQSFKDTMAILNSKSALLFNERLQIDDLLSLLDVFSEEEAYRLFEKQLDDIAEHEIEHYVDTVSKQTILDDEACRRILCSQTN